MSNIISELLSGLIGAVLACFITIWFQNKPNKASRKLTVKALNLFKKYLKLKYFSKVADDFNNTFSIPEKRSFLVALHKMGIPFDLESSNFDLKSVSFRKNVDIVSDDLDILIKHVKSGMFDQFFYKDIEHYVDSFSKVTLRREVAKRFVNEVVVNSTIAENGAINFGKGWSELSIGERTILLVFRECCLPTSELFVNGLIRKEKLSELCSDIDNGYLDYYLFQDYNNYLNIQNQNMLAILMKNSIPSSNIK